MNRSPIAIIFALAALWLSGCGTIQNLRSGEDMTPYGGLIKDSPGQMLLALDGPQQFHGSPLGIIVVVPIAVGEVCLTCIGDTLTLPVTCYVHAQRSWQEQTGHVGYGVAEVGDANGSAARNMPDAKDMPRALTADDLDTWSSIARNCLGPLPVQGDPRQEQAYFVVPARTDLGFNRNP